MLVFLHKIIFSSKAHFTLNALVNKQTCRACKEKNSREIPEKIVTFICGFLPGRIIDSVFVEDVRESAFTINGEPYNKWLKIVVFSEVT